MATANDRSLITDLLAALDRAHAERDAGAILALHAADAVIMDLAPPLARRGMGLGAVQAWLDTWDGPIGIESRDETLAIDGSMAFASALVRMRGRQQGRDQDLWFRSTTCLRRIDGRWLIACAHSSVPFHMDGSLRAAVDLQP